MVNATRSSGSFWRRLCRSLCREQGGKDAAMVALVAIVVGALVLQLGIGPAGGGGGPASSPSIRAGSAGHLGRPAPWPAPASPGA